MENASKALIIAGAILISILLISVGIIVMNAINNPVQQGAEAANAQAVEIFNGKFTGYGGKGQSGTTIKALFTAANSTVRPSDREAGTDTKIKFTGQTQSAVTVETQKRYDVDFVYDAKGYIKEVKISNGY